MPRELLPNGVGMTDENDAICFGYNCRKGCAEANDNEECKRGWHICAWKGCHEAHPYYKHRQIKKGKGGGKDKAAGKGGE